MRLPSVKSTKEYLKELYQRMKSDASEALSKKKKAFSDAGIDNVHMRVSIGNPAEQIFAMAMVENADLIIIGSIGRSGITRLKTLGSVSRSIGNQHCPDTWHLSDAHAG